MARPMGEREQDFRVYLSEKSDTIDARIDAILKTYEGLTLVPRKFPDVAIALRNLRNGDANFNQTFQDEDLSDDFEQRLDASIEALKKYKDDSDSFWHKLLRFLGLGKETLCGTEVTELLENLQWVKDSVEIAKHDRDLLDYQNAQANKERTNEAAAKQKDSTLSMNQQMDKQPSVAAQSAPVSQNPNVQMQQQAPNVQAATTQSAPVNPNPNVQASNAQTAAAQSAPVKQNPNPNVQVQQGSNRKTSGFQMSHTDSFDLSPKAQPEAEQKEVSPEPKKKTAFGKDELKIGKADEFVYNSSTTAKQENKKTNTISETKEGEVKITQTVAKKKLSTNLYEFMNGPRPSKEQPGKKEKLPLFAFVKESSEKKKADATQVNPPAADASPVKVPEDNIKRYTNAEWDALSSEDRIRIKKENAEREYCQDLTTFFEKDNEETQKYDSNQLDTLTEIYTKFKNDLGAEASQTQYIQHRINGIKKIEQLKKSAQETFRKKEQSELKTTKSDNITKSILSDVSQAETQRTDKGCWSVSLASMLGQKGVQIDQDTIRTYRPDHSYCIEDDIKNNNMDDGGNTIALFRDLAMDLVPDTAISSANYTESFYGANKGTLTPAEKETIRNGAKEIFSDLVKKAVLEDKAALGIQMYGHYRTICGVGQNEAGDIQNIYFYDPAQSQMQCETMDQMLDHFCLRRTEPSEHIDCQFEAQWLRNLTNDKGELALGETLEKAMQTNKASYADGKLKKEGTGSSPNGPNCIEDSHGNLIISSYLPNQIYGYKKTRVKSNLESLQQQEEKKIEPVKTEVKEKSPEKANTVETTASKQEEGATQEIAKTVTNISTVKNEDGLTENTESKSNLANLQPTAQQKPAAVRKAKSRENRFKNKLTTENSQPKRRSSRNLAPAKARGK